MIFRWLTLFLLICLSLGQNQAYAQDASIDENEILYLDALRALSEKRMNEAKRLLNKLIDRMPQHGGALLDLAMMHCELGNQREADRLFAVMKTSLPLDGEQQATLDKLHPQDCSQKNTSIHTSASVEIGHDSNVNQGASNPYYDLVFGEDVVTLQLLSDYQPKSDSYANFSFGMTKAYHQQDAQLFAQFRYRSYENLTQFNTMSGVLGLERKWDNPVLGFKSTFMLSALTLAGKLYQKQSILHLRSDPSWIFQRRAQLSFSATLGQSQYPQISNFNAHNYEVRAHLTKESQNQYWYSSVGLTTDRAHGDRPGGHRDGYLANLGWRRHLGGKLEAELSWNMQIWKNENVYSKELIPIQRRQNTQMLRAGLNWHLKQGHTLQLEWRTVRNRENISLLEYNGHQVQFGWSWQN